MINSTLQAIFDRRSIRRFEATPLTQDEIDTLVEVALASPTAVNRQPWHFHFVLDKEKSAAISEIAINTFRHAKNQELLDRMAARHVSIFYGAPLVIFISLPKNYEFQIDAGIAAQNLAIAAQSMGLGSCIIALAEAAFTGPFADETAKLLPLQNGHEFIISIAIGHPAITKEPHERHPEKVTII